jgi:ubiquinone/menaquinone biosynthesis C-methylase UbiE
LDTVNYKLLTPEAYKAETKKNWTAAPCGSNYSDAEKWTREYYDEIEAYRYMTHPWILSSIRAFGIKDKLVLEIGYGMGTDHLAMAREGGKMHGIDLTPINKIVAARRLELYGYNSLLLTGDAEQLPYDDNSFDFVYSFGVVHHTPDTQKVIDEIHRVLKPGGRCYITVYNKDSLFFWWHIFAVEWILQRDFLRETLKNRVSRIEYPNDNLNLVIKLYTKKEFASLFKKYGRVDCTINQFQRDDAAYIGNFLPEKWLSWFAKSCGWYIIVMAEK